MAFYFNEPSDNQKTASIRPMKWEEAGTVLSFDEMAITKNDAKYRVYLVLNKEFKCLYSDGEKKNKPVEKITGIPLFLDVKRKASTYKGKVTEQARLEVFLCSKLDSLEEGKTYAGTIALQDSPMLEMLMSGKQADGSPVDPIFATQAWGMIWNTKEVEANLLKGDLIETPKAYSGGSYGSSSQTEAEKLNDRFEFIKKQLAVIDPNYQVKTPVDFMSAMMIATGTDKAIELQLAVQACTILMGLPRGFDD